MRILFDKNVPIGVRRFLLNHTVRTFTDLQWYPQLENGALLKAGEAAGFDVMITSDQNIRYQQNLTERKLALVASAPTSGRLCASMKRQLSMLFPPP